MPGLHHATPGDDTDRLARLLRPPALQTTGLVKRFGQAVAVDGIDLVMGPGEVRGLVGPNGAGKTTLLRLLLGLIVPDAGAVELLGQTIGAASGAIPNEVAGFVEDPAFYPYLTGRANLEVLADLDGDQRPDRGGIDDALAQVGLASHAELRVNGYSTGMRQRLGVAAALLRAPRLLLLDEPTSGLDPGGSRRLRALVRDLADAGTSVLISSHLIGELEDLCDTFTVLRRGQVAWDGTIEELRRQAPASSYCLSTTDDRVALEVAAPLPAIDVAPHPDLQLRVTGAQPDVDAYVLALGRADVAVRRLELVTSPLESIFLMLTEEPASSSPPTGRSTAVDQPVAT